MKTIFKIQTVITLFILTACSNEVRIENLNMDSILINEVPNEVIAALQISHNPKKSNPWGNEFWTNSCFQNLDKNPNRFALKIDKEGGSFGYKPCILKMSGHQFILNRKFNQGEGPFLLFNNQLFFLVKNSWKANLDSSTIGVIDLSPYLKN